MKYNKIRTVNFNTYDETPLKNNELFSVVEVLLDGYTKRY